MNMLEQVPNATRDKLMRALEDEELTFDKVLNGGQALQARIGWSAGVTFAILNHCAEGAGSDEVNVQQMMAGVSITDREMDAQRLGQAFDVLLNQKMSKGIQDALNINMDAAE